ncbi:MAG: alpha/beta hydrolase [Gammaproteobacteria bacterium]|nr:alpha/beta hydrolase [Gammaproteobacteria bacterium]MBV9697391.1 alpha/beta hydrolase [Gammaproteobacteria bacterium]
MPAPSDASLSIEVPEHGSVSARCLTPRGARAGYVLAHGAGAGMDHPLLRAVAAELAAAGIATLRFQFPYLERGARRVDAPPVCHATVRAAVACAAEQWPSLPLFAGGRSFGGRMSSQAQALAPLPGVLGLAFLGFPLHPAGRPGAQRAAHLAQVQLPMLFIQGERDTLASAAWLVPMLQQLGARATLEWVPRADHGFHTSPRTGRTDAELRTVWLGALVRWMDGLR